jgi:hypothetical protein
MPALQQHRRPTPCPARHTGPRDITRVIGSAPVARSWRPIMSKSNGEVVSVTILPNSSGTPQGKLADAEVIFGAASGPLEGLRLIGFAVWERRGGGRNVTFPARQYSVNGERRSYALLRPVNGDASVQDAIRQCILDAYSRVEAAN